MSPSWLELLSNVDTMVLGGIVSSVVLAFVLVVVIFSIKIKMQHDHIEHLQVEVAKRDRQIQTEQELQKKAHRDVSDAQTVMEHYQQQEETLLKELIGIRQQLETAQMRRNKLRLEAGRLSEEKQVLVKTIETLRTDMEHAQTEVDAARKRNEFWIAQIAELRTKHEALKLKLTFQQGRTA